MTEASNPTLPVLVVAASIPDAKALVAAAGIELSTILTPRSYAQVGRVIRAVVVTPAFASLIAEGDQGAGRALRCARIDARKCGIHF